MSIKIKITSISKSTWNTKLCIAFESEGPTVPLGAPDTDDTLAVKEEVDGSAGSGDTEGGRDHTVSTAMNDLSIKEEVSS